MYRVTCATRFSSSPVKQPAVYEHSFAISPHNSREVCFEFLPLRNQRAQGMPGDRCARSLACSVENTRVSHHGHTGSSGIPYAVVLRLTSCSPRRSGLFVTVACASSRRLDAGVEASEPHDFAVRKSAPSSLAPPASTASRPASVTIASRPSVGRDRIAIFLFLPGRQAKIRKFRNNDPLRVGADCAQEWSPND